VRIAAVLCVIMVGLISARANAAAQRDLYGQWHATTVITTGGYSERYNIVLSLGRDGSFSQTVQSQVFRERIVHTIGTFSPLPALGQSVYRFVVPRPNKGEMPAWNARLALRSPATLLYEDLTSGGSLQFQRAPNTGP
jgi:hypothetical protein